MKKLKVILTIIILFLLSGAGVMAVTTKTKTVKISLSNGYDMTVLTTKTKVLDILKENNILILDSEKVSPKEDEELTEGEAIVITNKSEQEIEVSKVSKSGEEITLDSLLDAYATITEKIEVVQEEIPFETVKKDVSNGASSTKNKVLQQGQNGIKEIKYRVKYQNEQEIERNVISEIIIQEPVDKIVQIANKVSSRSSARTVASYNGKSWSYSASDMDLICAITAQEDSSSYTGALAVITTACNRATRNGTDPLTEYKKKGQFCYSIDSYWKRRLNGNYAGYVEQAVIDALNGKRNHNYTSFRASGSGERIGGNVYR